MQYIWQQDQKSMQKWQGASKYSYTNMEIVKKYHITHNDIYNFALQKVKIDNVLESLHNIVGVDKALNLAKLV